MRYLNKLPLLAILGPLTATAHGPHAATDGGHFVAHLLAHSWPVLAVVALLLAYMGLKGKQS